MSSNEKAGFIDQSKGKDPLPSYMAATTPFTTATATSSSTPFHTQFASLSMHREDRLRFLSFPSPIVTLCRTTILNVWARGIQAEKEYGGSQEFKLYGNPWRGSGDQAIAARRLICALLSVLHEQGWVMTLSTDVSKKLWDKDTLLFRYQAPAPAPCDWLCIGFSRMDRIKFIDTPAAIYETLIQKLGPSWVQARYVYPNATGVYEIKLAGTPWMADGTETMRVRGLLLVFLEVLEGEGWTVYASVDQKNGGDKSSETDTWHCCRPKGWTRGAPVYH
ncbi:hypothetical protein P154DRAFT_462494, partial [Amniculicola lignicola CBS 123094]